MGGAGEEEWVKAAMTDDTTVAELLVSLHGAAPPRLERSALPLEWTVRQRRSKPVSANTNPKKRARASPTTPLSWSGATSVSGGSGGAAGGGSEESSRPLIQKLTRSKVSGDNGKTTSKRSRKKKTSAELKDEINSLLKEKRELKREMSAWQMNLEKLRAKNEKLKRMKIECQPLLDREMTLVTNESTSDQHCPKTVPCHHDTPIITPNGYPKPDAGAAFDPTFALPDLNIPFEDDPNPDVVVHGVS